MGRLVLIAEEVIDQFGTRTVDGRLLSFRFSEQPVDKAQRGEPIFDLIVTATDDGMAVVPRSIVVAEGDTTR